MKKILIALFIIVLLASCTPEEAGISSDEGTNGTTQIAIEDIKMQMIDSDDVSINDLKGNIVIIDFWASWCGPCNRSIPFYNRMNEKYGEQGLIIIGINVNEDETTIKKAKQDYEINYYLALPDEKFSTHFKVQGIPAMFMFDRDGKLIDEFVGYSPELDNKIESLIIDNI